MMNKLAISWIYLKLIMNIPFIYIVGTQIRNDPKLILGSYVNGPTNIICRAWVWKARLWSPGGGLDGSGQWISSEEFVELCVLIILLCSRTSWLGRRVVPTPPLFGAWAFTLYRPSQSILTLHPLIRKVPTRVPVPSAASPYFLLVALTEATLVRSPFSLIRLVRLWAHLMRRWRLLFEPSIHFIPVWVPFCSPSLLRALWRLPLTIY